MFTLSMRNISNSRHSRLVVCVFIVLMLAAIGVGGETYRRLVESEQQQVQQTLHRIADMQAAGISAWVKERIGNARVHVDSALLGEMIRAWTNSTETNQERNRARILGRLALIKQTYGYREVAIVEPESGIWISTKKSGVPLNPTAQQTIKRSLSTNTIQVSGIYVLDEAATQARVVDIVAPILIAPEASAQASYVLILIANADVYLHPYVRSLPLLETSTNVLLAETHGQQVIAVSANVGMPGFGYLDALPVAREEFESAAHATEGHLEIKDNDGSTLMAVARRIDDAPWYLVTMLDQAAVSGHLSQLAWVIAGVEVSILTFIGMALFLWWKRMESKLRFSSFRAVAEKQFLQQRYDSLSKYANDMIILADAGGRIIDVNDKAVQILGHGHDAVLQTTVQDLFLPFCKKTLDDAFATLQHREAALFEVFQQHTDGSVLAIEASARAIELRGERFIQLICRDITAHKETEAALKQSQERFNSILESILDMVWSFAPDLTRLHYINHSVETIFGYPVAECMADPQVLFNAIVPEDRPMVRSTLLSMNHASPSAEIEFRMQRKNGELLWMHARSKLVFDDSGFPVRIDGVATDITQRKKAEQQVQELAYYDNVTGLPNRALLNDRLTQAVQMALRSHKKVALLYMDLDNFKNVNDSLGHHVGDMLLRSIAERLLQCVRAEDTVARIGGDEFIVVLPDIERGEQATSVADKILAATIRPFMLQGQQVHTSISIGISVHPEDSLDPHELIRHADSALYQAKNHGRNNYQFFTRELNHQIARALMVERHLRHAIDNEELSLWYQPQINVADGRIIGAEALLRWRQGNRDFLSPVEFIPVAEERGLIGKIGEWVLGEACRQCRQWQVQGLQPIPVAVNISPLQFQQKDFATVVTRILNECQLAPTYLELEITESSIMRRASVVAALAMQLREVGVSISIDDFGTGYSSLSYLRQIPIDKIKIDRSFISDMMHDVDSESITSAIINLAHSLGLRVIAEGVESKAQVERLLAFGCHEVQGNYYCAAVPAETFRTFLEHGAGFLASQLIREQN